MEGSKVMMMICSEIDPPFFFSPFFSSFFFFFLFFLLLLLFFFFCFWDRGMEGECLVSGAFDLVLVFTDLVFSVSVFRFHLRASCVIHHSKQEIPSCVAFDGFYDKWDALLDGRMIGKLNLFFRCVDWMWLEEWRCK